MFLLHDHTQRVSERYYEYLRFCKVVWVCMCVLVSFQVRKSYCFCSTITHIKFQNDPTSIGRIWSSPHLWNEKVYIYEMASNDIFDQQSISNDYELHTVGKITLWAFQRYTVYWTLKILYCAILLLNSEKNQTHMLNSHKFRPKNVAIS